MRSIGLLVVVVSLANARLAAPPGEGEQLEPAPADKTEVEDATYWISYSQDVRPGHDFEINVHILKGNDPVSVRVALVDAEGSEIETGSGDITPGILDMITLQIDPDIRPPELIENEWHRPWYGLTVEGRDSNNEVVFTNKGRAQYQPKAFTIFVQTNKPLYKPGEEVKFRLLAMTPDMKVISGEPWSADVKDPEGRLMWEQKDIVDPNGYGVVEMTFPMADKVPIGEWSITAYIRGSKETKMFTVQEYVLPKFDVELITKPYGLSTDRHLPIKVRARYTFGKPLSKANFTLVVWPSYHHCMYHCREKEERWKNFRQHYITWTDHLDENGEFSVNLSKQKILWMIGNLTAPGETYGLDTLLWKSLKLEVNVTNPHTGHMRQDEASIFYYPTDYQAQFLGITPGVFKPGLGWTGYLEVKKQDGSRLTPAEASGLQMEFNVTYWTHVTVEIEINKDEPEEKPKPIGVESSSIDGELNEETGSSPGGNNAGRQSSGGTLAAASASSGTTTRSPLPRPKQEPASNTGTTTTIKKQVWKNHVLQVEETVRDVSPEGWVTFSFHATVPETVDSLNIEGRIIRPSSPIPMQYTQVFKHLNRARSPSHSYLQMHVPTKRFKVGDNVEVGVIVTEEISKIDYQVYSKGMLITTGAIESENPTDEFFFNLDLTQNMAPVVRVVVFYIRDENHEFVVDALTMNVDGLFQKPISMEFSSLTAAPQDTVTLKVKQDVGDSRAFVYVMSNDKSLYLLKTGNDIDQDMVREELMEYDYGEVYPWMRYMFICGWPSSYGRVDAKGVLEAAGIQVLTDGLIYSASHERWHGDKFPSAVEDSNLAGSSGGGENVDESTTNKQETEQKAAKVRKDFPENWLWQVAEILPGENEAELNLTAPDTITSWVTTAFSVHPQYGPTPVEAPVQLRTFKPLTVQLDLPYSITRDEDFCFVASVFNYHTSAVQVKITLSKSPSYESIFWLRDGKKVKGNPNSGSYTYLIGKPIPSDGIRSETFCFTPTEVGLIPVRVRVETAANIGLVDIVERKLKVVPQGVSRSTSQAALITVGESMIADVSKLKDFVKDSQSITVFIVDNLLGQVLDGIDSLLKRPYGCGEQNMLNFAPLNSALGYYARTGTLTPEILAKGRKFMAIGYQKAGAYVTPDGGFGNFGNRGRSRGSTWLTAFILKCIAMAQKLNDYAEVIVVDENFIPGALDFLMAQQDNQTGSFVENGRVFNTFMQGGASSSSRKGVALTAYTVIAFYHAGFGTDQPEVSDAVDFLSDELDSLTDVFDLCITAYALALIDHKDKVKAFEKMKQKSTFDEKEGFMYWKRNVQVKRQDYFGSTRADSITVETTAYALLCYLLHNSDMGQYLPVVQFLIHERGPDGGWYSTQDTVISLQALSSLPDEMFTNMNLPYDIEVSYDVSASETKTEKITISQENERVVNSIEIPYKNEYPTTVSITTKTSAEGETKSTIFAEVVSHFNVIGEEEPDYFFLDHKLDVKDSLLTLNITVKTNGEDEEVGMSNLKLDIPSGFSPDMERIDRSPSRKYLSNIEFLDNQLVLYFDTGTLSAEPITISIYLNRDSGVSVSQNPVTYNFLVYLYYSPDKETVVPYTLTVNEVCEAGPTLCQYV